MAAAGLLELMKGKSQGLPEPLIEYGKAEFLDHQPGHIIGKSPGEPGHQGHTNRNGQPDKHPPDQFLLPQVTGIHRKHVYDLPENDRIKELQDFGNSRQSHGQKQPPFKGPEIFPDDLHESIFVACPSLITQA